MTDLRKLARGKPCMVRLPGCDGGGETTVLAHLRMSGYCGTSMKPDDLAFGAWCCARCHDAIDGRVKTTMTHDELHSAHADGVLRTVAALRKIGAIK